ncbi:MAG: peptidyl-prolyl cis-trans isomerase SurA [Alteromonadaceae bacterium]|jgi:peptidyl-prolyl cis-trans isomerase SurA|tara:strand:+ start:2184 stop:3485 length:1302 start_codon:yes stop_codon:yes gene_type:complete
MKNLLKVISLSTLFIFGTMSVSHAEEKLLDRVAVIVNDGVVLESEIVNLMKKIKYQAEQQSQSLPSDNALRIQVTEKLINDTLIIQIGERMGIQVSDAELDQTMGNMANDNKMTLEQLRQSVVEEGSSYEKYRESVRTELISGQVSRGSVRRRIYISPQEVNNLLSSMKEQTINDVDYQLGHILIEFPSDANAQEMATQKDKADKVITLLNSGSDFTKIAMSSSGASNALTGGDLGWKNINEMPTLFSELVEGKSKGDVFGPIRTGLGFSIVKILDIRGRQVVEIEEVKASHILIKPSVILSEAKAEAMLQDLLDQINAGSATFEVLAKEHSEGPTSIRGGDLGWAEAQIYDPAFKDALASMNVDEYHKPFRSSFGWHIVQLTGRRTVDATNQMNENRAYQMLYNRQYDVEQARWIKETRNEAYIEVLGTVNK